MLFHANFFFINLKTIGLHSEKRAFFLLLHQVVVMPVDFLPSILRYSAITWVMSQP